jgi:hypothetical protein
MKKFIFQKGLIAATVAFFLILAGFTLAQEESTPSTKASPTDVKVQTLKDKLATKVAELRKSIARFFR